MKSDSSMRVLTSRVTVTPLIVSVTSAFGSADVLGMERSRCSCLLIGSAFFYRVCGLADDAACQRRKKVLAIGRRGVRVVRGRNGVLGDLAGFAQIFIGKFAADHRGFDIDQPHRA